MNETTCPVCKSLLRGLGPVTGDAKRFDCPNCGRSKISNTELAILDGRFKKSPVFSAILSHAIRRDQNSGEEWPFFDSYRVDKIEEDERLPNPAKQVDNLVFWLGKAQGHP